MVNVTIYSIHGSYGILMYIAYALGLVTAALQSARVTSAHLNLWLPWLLQQASPSSSDWFRMSQDAKRASDDPSPLMGFAHVTKQALYISLWLHAFNGELNVTQIFSDAVDCRNKYESDSWNRDQSESPGQRGKLNCCGSLGYASQGCY